MHSRARGASSAMTECPSTADPERLFGVGVFAQLRYVWLFQCSHRTALHAATLDKLGRNLPEHACTGGTWNCVGQLIVGPKRHRHIGVNTAALKAGIEQEGFFLWIAEIETPPGSLTLMR